MKQYKKVGIICAMDAEAALLINAMENPVRETVSGMVFTRGTIENTDTIVAVCGVGKIFAAMCTEAMIIKYSPDCIINSGVAGAPSDVLDIGDIAIASSLVQHDMDTTGMGDPLGFISGLGLMSIPCTEDIIPVLEDCISEQGIHYKVGVIASGDEFIHTQEKRSFLAGHFDAIACEMESVAIGLTCYVNNVDFGIIRSISDNGNEEATLDFPRFVIDAADKAAKTAVSFLKKISC